jgi:hypothetical protein
MPPFQNANDTPLDKTPVTDLDDSTCFPSSISTLAEVNEV